MRLSGFDAAAFLRNDWQRQPRLLRGALPHFQSPLNPGELAGLALEDEVESRIVQERDGNWQVAHGPFEEHDFKRPAPWTLLVQGVDRLLPDVEALLQLVDFLPHWRVDDIMVSYATEGGSVGPHFDHYDVFLLQGHGQRTWRLGQWCDDNSALRPGTDLRILADFEQSAEYLLRPGDILYVPPGLAHWGIGHGDCMTYSLGFRAPRLNDALSRWADQVLEQLPADRFYRDPPLPPVPRPGEITGGAVKAARAQLLAVLQEDADPRWFGELVTEPAPDAEMPGGSLPLADGIASLARVSGSRLAWSEHRSALLVFANGITLHTGAASRGTLETLCRHGALSGDALAAALATAQTRELLQQLTEAGCIDAQ